LFSKELHKLNYDIVVICGGTEYGAYLKTSKPIYYILDRTIEGAINYHPVLSNLLRFSEQQSILTDKTAMLNSSKTFFSSEWAANHAKQFYILPSTKSSILPFGANLDKLPTRETALQVKNTSVWNLLIIGTSWKNKGIEIAINTLNILIGKNIEAHLTIVGCTPSYNLNNKHVTIIPFVNKNSVNGVEKMWDLFLSHHFFYFTNSF
jgi:glycosyltransferase involved in cell wall biosynthesis